MTAFIQKSPCLVIKRQAGAFLDGSVTYEACAIVC